MQLNNKNKMAKNCLLTIADSLLNSFSTTKQSHQKFDDFSHFWQLPLRTYLRNYVKLHW